MLNDCTFSSVLQEAAVLLREMPRESGRVREAQKLVSNWREQYPQLNIGLLVDRPPGSLRVDYDLLLSHPDNGTIVMAWQGDDEMPWTVCHSDHSAANFVVSINDQHLSVQQALLLLRMSANGHPDLMASMVNQIILSEVVSQEDVAVTVEELQEAADRFRQSKGLLSAAAMRQWLEDMRLSQVAFEEMLEMTVKTRKVKERVTAERLDAYFESHRQEYDQVQLFEVKVATEELAAQLMNQAQEIGLLVATQKMLADSSLSGLEGTLTTRYADTLPSDLHSSPPGKIIGPYIENKQYVVAQVYSRQPAQLTGQTLDAVQEAVYQEWLAQKRAAATIRWHWM